MPTILIVLAFAFGFSVIVAVNFAFVDVSEVQRQRARQRMEQAMRVRQKEQARSSLVNKDLYQQAAEGLNLHVRLSLRDRLNKALNQSGLTIQPAQVVLGGIALAMLAWAAVAGTAAAPLPLLFVFWCRKRRANQMRAQLPEAFDLMCRTMRSGQTIAQALQSVADEFPPPIAAEFGFCYDQQNLGLSPEASMHDLAERTGLLELKIFVMAVAVHRQTGGNVSVLLEKLAKVVRERQKMLGSIQALTAEGKMQGMILLGLPPGIMLVMFFLNRPYVMQLFAHPSLLVAMAVSMSLGALWMRKIINFDF
ncbi:MAG: type II secretion system F family protein [Planctomycetota bacterium]|nr:type II secretion system F family protein [Planctomycetota bacterium]